MYIVDLRWFHLVSRRCRNYVNYASAGPLYFYLNTLRN